MSSQHVWRRGCVLYLAVLFVALFGAWSGQVLALQNAMILASDGFESGDESGGTGPWMSAWSHDGQGLSSYAYEGAKSWWLGESATGNYLARQVDVTGYLDVRLRYCVEAWGMETSDSVVLKVNGAVLQSFSGDWGAYQCFEQPVPSGQLTLRFETSVNRAWEGIFIDAVELLGVPDTAIEPNIAWDGFESGDGSGGSGVWRGIWWTSGLGPSEHAYQGEKAWWIGEHSGFDFMTRGTDTAGYKDTTISYCVEPWGMEGSDYAVLLVNKQEISRFTGNTGAYTCETRSIPSDVLNIRFETHTNGTWEGLFIDDIVVNGTPDPAAPLSREILAWDGFESGDLSGGTGAWSDAWSASSLGPVSNAYEGTQSWFVGEHAAGDYLQRTVDVTNYTDVKVRYCVQTTDLAADVQILVNGALVHDLTGIDVGSYKCYAAGVPSGLVTLRFQTSGSSAGEGIYVDAVEVSGIYQAQYLGGVGQVPPPTSALQARIMSFNLRWAEMDDGPNNWEFRRDVAYEVLEDFTPDTVGTQEPTAYQIDDIEAHFDGIAVQPELDSYRFSTYTQQVLYNNEHLTLLGAGGFLLHEGVDGTGDIHYCTWVHVQDVITGRAYYHYNVHLHGGTAKLSAIRLMQHIAVRSTNDPFVVTGDFNAAENSAVINFLRGEQTLPDIDGQPYTNPIPLVDTYRVLHPDATNSGTAGGFSGSQTGNKIDYVFVQAGAASVLTAEIVHTNLDGQYPSDHFPVTAVIEWP